MIKNNIKAWDEVFKEKGKVFLEVQEDIPEIAKMLKKKNLIRILDLGCGTGRHLIYFAKRGFRVYGLDNSDEGIKISRRWLKENEFDAELVVQNMTDRFPYCDRYFDAIVSIQVIHHSTIAQIKKIVTEIERCLKTNGFIFITVPRSKHQAEKFKKIEPNTFIPLDGPEKGLPHHYSNVKELKNIFKNFSITDIHLDKGDHYCLSGYKK